MSYSIGLAGKGGTGKTTLAGWLVRYLVEGRKGPVLAVDADSNANLNEVLGVAVEETLGGAREEMKKGVATGMTKDVFMEMKLEQSVVEADGFDLIVMGRPEGSGCYCAANTLLTQYLDRLVNNYPYVVIDNEAGMEHISRLTTNNIDLLLIVSDASRRGVLSAGRIQELADDLTLNIDRKAFVVNMAREDQTEALQELAREYGLDLVGLIPDDDSVTQADLQGQPTMGLDRESRSVKAAFDIFDRLLNVA
ncbi:MAG: AAA family ATPase [Deltaproteobacteria bacterium]|nr:AAA family ATPase [Deltaproteobacteria bacterium]